MTAFHSKDGLRNNGHSRFASICHSCTAWIMILSAISFGAASAIVPTSRTPSRRPDITYEKSSMNLITDEYNSLGKTESPTKIEVKNKIDKTEQELVKLMDEPKCREHCKELQKHLHTLKMGLEVTVAQLALLNDEMTKVWKSCSNGSSAEDDSSELQLTLAPGAEVLDEVKGRGDDEVVDHDLAATQIEETKIDPIRYDTTYSPSSILPESGVVLDRMGSGPLEPVQSSQQVTVTLPQSLQKLCTLTNGERGRQYICSEYNGEQSPHQDLYLQSRQMHVPTSIPTFNPYTFPGQSGYPLNVPSTATAPGQLMPLYNPDTGKIYFQNYPQNPGYGQIYQFPQLYNLMRPVQLMSPVQAYELASPVEQYAFSQLPPPGDNLVPLLQPQFAVPEYNVPYTQPFYQSQLFQTKFPPPPMMKCDYVILPNTSSQTNNTPAVNGVSQTIQRDKQSDDEDHDKPSMPVAKQSNLGICLDGTQMCEDGSDCIDNNRWCDSKIDCPDSSDERVCTCMQRIKAERLCDGYFDCPKGEDELGCFGCMKDMFSCDDYDESGSDVTCLPIEKRCDFNKDCPNGKDEMDCNIITDAININEAPVISYSRGFLLRNWRGIWFPVCSSSTWQIEACSTEFGIQTGLPRTRYYQIDGYYGTLLNQTENDACPITDPEGCLGQRQGTALWVDCPTPECGVKIKTRNLRRKRQSNEQPKFDTSPAALAFVKNFFDSTSALDRKAFYKQFWGPLVQPYMGVKDVGNARASSSSNEGYPFGPHKSYYPTNPNYIEHHVIPSQPIQMSPFGYYIDYYTKDYNNNKRYGRKASGFEGYDPNLLGFEGFDPDLSDFDGYDPDFTGFKGYDPNLASFQGYDPSFYDFDEYYSDEADLRDDPDLSDFDIYEDSYRKKRDPMLRVVGGGSSEPGAWPWLVGIYKDGKFNCGGTIIAPTIILTAAHCVDGTSYYEVQAGILRRRSFSPQEQIRKVEHIIMHENYNRKLMINDIALIILSTPLKYNRWVLPVCLPPQGPYLMQLNIPPPGTFCTAIGWGVLYENGPDPDNLQEVQVPILAHCKHLPDRLGNEICAGYPEGGMDTCQGDSGGPLLCRIEKDKWYIAGIVSHGDGCARLNEAGVYTRVSIYIDWIKQQLSSPYSVGKASRSQCPGVVCSSGLCLHPSYRCNSRIDCLHGEDEMNCGGISAPFFQGRTAAVAENSSVAENSGFQTDTDSPLREVTETVGIETTTKEIEIHSEQLEPVDISNLYSCKKIKQRIISSRVCDRVVDCEDGTDEIDCSCKDYLKNASPSLICNGQIDCQDSTDEEDCPERCSKNEFYCYKSDVCIALGDQCNSKIDCVDGEDEQNCYFLIKENVTELNTIDKPAFHLSGTLAFNSNGTWKMFCNDGKFTPSRAIQVCRQLGFGILRSFKEVTAKINNCSTIFIRCSSPLENLWLAPLFESGLLLTLGILVERNWLLAPVTELNSKVYINTWLAKTNLKLKVKGPFDQYIRVDGIVNTPGNSNIKLLHLEEPAEINEKTVPLFFPDWPTPVSESEKCEALGLVDQELVSIELKPYICRNGIRCYTIQEKDPISCKFTGFVVCHSSNGPYLAAAVTESLCSSTLLIELSDLAQDKKNFIKQMELNSYDELKEETCNGVRCESGECLNWDKVGDGIADCFDGADENNNLQQEKIKHCQTNNITCSCQPGFIRCRGGDCISATHFCDNKTDCEDGSDEENCNCAGYLSMAKPSYLCDGVLNCKDKSDESYQNCMNTTNCSAFGKFPCHLSGSCVPNSFVCDGLMDCPNGEDENICIAIRSPLDKQKEGLLFSRLYGELVPHCLEEQDELAEKVCAQMGSSAVEHHYSKVPYEYVETDVFSVVSLNDRTELKIRADRPFASVQTKPNETCSALYIVCK